MKPEEVAGAGVPQERPHGEERALARLEPCAHRLRHASAAQGTLLQRRARLRRCARMRGSSSRALMFNVKALHTGSPGLAGRDLCMDAGQPSVGPPQELAMWPAIHPAFYRGPYFFGDACPRLSC